MFLIMNTKYKKMIIKEEITEKDKNEAKQKKLTIFSFTNSKNVSIYTKSSDDWIWNTIPVISYKNNKYKLDVCPFCENVHHGILITFPIKISYCIKCDNYWTSTFTYENKEINMTKGNYIITYSDGDVKKCNKITKEIKDEIDCGKIAAVIDILNVDNPEIYTYPYGWDYIENLKQKNKEKVKMENDFTKYVYLVIKEMSVFIMNKNYTCYNCDDLTTMTVEKIFEDFDNAKKYTRKIATEFIDDLNISNVDINYIYSGSESYIIEMMNNETNELVAKYFVEKKELET